VITGIFTINLKQYLSTLLCESFHSFWVEEFAVSLFWYTAASAHGRHILNKIVVELQLGLRECFIPDMSWSWRRIVWALQRLLAVVDLMSWFTTASDVFFFRFVILIRCLNT